MLTSSGIKLGKDSVDYSGLIEDLKGAKANFTDDSKYTAALGKEINRILYKAVAQQMQTLKQHGKEGPLQPEGLENFFDFLIGLEEAQLIQKKEILLAFMELFEIAQE